MAYRVKVSPSALADVERCYEWMRGEYSEAQATKWYNGLVDAIYSLKEYPQRCPLAPDAAEIGTEIRQLLYGKCTATYRIIFKVFMEGGEDVVRVYRVWHGARDRIKVEDIDFNG